MTVHLMCLFYDLFYAQLIRWVGDECHILSNTLQAINKMNTTRSFTSLSTPKLIIDLQYLLLVLVPMIVDSDDDDFAWHSNCYDADNFHD
jgi:hypothetical protein